MRTNLKKLRKQLRYSEGFKKELVFLFEKGTYRTHLNFLNEFFTLV